MITSTTHYAPAPTASPAADEAVLTRLDAALFAVARSVWHARVAEYIADVPVDRAGLSILSRSNAVGTARISDLAGCLGLDMSTVSRHVRALEDAGLMHREPDPADRRASLVEVSAEGRAVLAKVQAASAARLGTATAHWSEDDRATLAVLLTRLADDLQPTHPRLVSQESR